MVSVKEEKQVSDLVLLQAEDIWEALVSLGYPGAIWKLPHTRDIKLLISIRDGIKQCQPDIEKLSPGFMLSPFHWEETENVSFMEGDIIITFSETGMLQNIDNHIGEEHPGFKKLIRTALAGIGRRSKSEGINHFMLPGSEDPDARERFKRTVELAVAAIRQNHFHKVVLSRTKELDIDNNFQPITAFQKLAGVYPHAFVSLVNLPENNELWLGATPELLVQQKSGGEFKTMSLAGTQPAKNENGVVVPKYDIRWGEKEIEEQALVSRYIVECFKKIRLREYKETGPKTVLAGNLYHLRTDFEVDSHALHFPELPSVMLRLLHPTSAVCGTPKTASLRFITDIEGYDRSFYSGFLGPVQIEGDSNIFVNLRTVRLKDKKATFYAGAGITEDSIPEKEWEETEMKIDTLLQVITKS
ncbi:Isochorismate synthase MenF [Dyadobacter sp. CECT 9275]|uniref:Isochorismate synthase MenF n=1 Tax=Dyadobacter helix TaxID=2822344 RepID=A0A916JGN3_9BACT|nr:chorismate-binding protein [Dyadobacter sp. CECT 9275]CAG5002681.1 Isochorismate synthase MenF [Dyadobacter sp. CECT 9275]